MFWNLGRAMEDIKRFKLTSSNGNYNEWDGIILYRIYSSLEIGEEKISEIEDMDIENFQN